MVFVEAKNESAVLIFMTEKDIKSIREGRTVFVDDRATGGVTFKKVVIGHAPTNEDALLMIEKVRPGTTGSPATHEPRNREVRCDGCGGIMEPQLLDEGRCICCWKMVSRKLRLEMMSRGVPLPADL